MKAFLSLSYTANFDCSQSCEYHYFSDNLMLCSDNLSVIHSVKKDPLNLHLVIISFRI